MHTKVSNGLTFKESNLLPILTSDHPKPMVPGAFLIRSLSSSILQCSLIVGWKDRVPNLPLHHLGGCVF